MTGMHENGRELLRSLRIDRRRWNSVLVTEPARRDPLARDPNGLARHRVWVALQYDRRPEDHELIRGLFEQEVIARQRDVATSNETNTLELGAFLLATYRDPADVWLFWRARKVSMDAASTVDESTLVAAGVEETYAYLERTPHPEREAVYGDLGRTARDCRVKTEDFEWWLDFTSGSYPNSEDKEDPLTLAWRAVEFGAQDEGRTILAELEGRAPSDTATVAEIARLREAVGRLRSG